MAGAIARLGAVACVAAGGLGLFGAFFEPLDLINQPAALWLAIGWICLAWVWLGRRGRPSWFWLAASVLFLLVSARALGPDLVAGPQPSSSAPAATEIRIVSFNLYKQNDAPALDGRWIAAQDPDIVVLTEAGGHAAVIPAMLQAAYPFRVTCRRSQRCSTMILSRLPFEGAGGLGEGDPERRGVGLSAAWARVRTPAGLVTVVGAHLTRPWPWGDHRAQVDELVRLAAPYLGPRTIVAGDFNATPQSFALQHLERGLGLRRATRAKPTWPLRWPCDCGLPDPVPILGIDHVFVGSALAVQRVESGTAQGSDHRPLIVDVEAQVALAAPVG